MITLLNGVTIEGKCTEKNKWLMAICRSKMWLFASENKIKDWKSEGFIQIVSLKVAM